MLNKFPLGLPVYVSDSRLSINFQERAEFTREPRSDDEIRSGPCNFLFLKGNLVLST